MFNKKNHKIHENLNPAKINNHIVFTEIILQMPQYSNVYNIVISLKPAGDNSSKNVSWMQLALLGL